MISHTVYIWSAYLITFVGLLGFIFSSYRQSKQIKQRLQRVWK